MRSAAVNARMVGNRANLVQVVHSGKIAVGPCRAAEEGAPVGGLAAIWSRWLPDVHVASVRSETR